MHETRVVRRGGLGIGVRRIAAIAGRREAALAAGVGNTANESIPHARFLRAQAIVMLAAASIALGHGMEAAYSALLGGLIALLSDYWFARRVFRRYTDRSPEEAAALMLRAEIVKLALAVLMFAAVFALIMALNVVALLAGFVLVKATAVVASVRDI